MLALEYYYSIPRYLLAKSLSSLFPRRFFPRVVPLRLKKVSFTKPRPDWVVLRPLLCGICGSDLNLLRGVESYILEPYASFPCILGHEVVAEVVEAPADSGFNPGERVAVEPILACQARGGAPCRFCARGDYNLCEHFTQGELPAGAILGFTRGAGGGLAELMAAPPGNLFRLPDKLPDETAVLVDSLASALQATREGAYDYLRKPFNLQEIEVAVDNAARLLHLREENGRLLAKLNELNAKLAELQQESAYPEADLPPADHQRGPDPLRNLLWCYPLPWEVDPPHPSDLERLLGLYRENLLTEKEFQILKERMLI